MGHLHKWPGFALLSIAAQSVMAAFLELSPGNAGDFTYVESPTSSAVAELRAAGKRPLVEAAAFTNWAENASAVAFLQLPRRHLMHTWKTLGVTVLKTVRFQPEGSATRFRREASFIAFQGGADGIWLPDAERLPPGWREALAEAREDWRILLYLKSLADEAAQSDDFAVRAESRRVAYWFGWMPASWENVDTLRLECVVWARRLEGLLDAYLAGGFPDEAVAFTRKRLEDLELSPKEKGVLHVKMAYAYVQKEDWNHAVQMFRAARIHVPQNKREDLQTEGLVAEKRGDWATAVACYGDEAKTYSKEEEAKKLQCVKRLNAAMAKLRGTSKEGEIASIDDLGENAIDLDE